MDGEWVLDASVAVKCFITEVGSTEARALAASGARLSAPEFIHAEIASVAVKRAWRGDIGRGFAAEIIEATPELLDETVPVSPLVGRAAAIALEFRTSVYDALYLALAEARDTTMITADDRLARKLAGTSLEHRIRRLTPP